MLLTLDNNMSAQEKNEALTKAYLRLQEKKREAKLAVLKKIRGNVKFDKTGKKSALDIQREMRDEWK